MKILVLPGSNRIAQEILNSLRSVRGAEIFGAGFDLDLGKSMPYDSYHYVNALHDDTDNEVETVVNQLGIELVFLTHDDWINSFANKETIGFAKIVKSSSKSIGICLFKRNTYSFFQHAIRVPQVFNTVDEVSRYPIFVKPNRGQGSKHSKIIDSLTTLESVLNEHKHLDMVLCEYLPGPEFTVDCFTNYKGNLMYIAARQRDAHSDGMSKNTWFVDLIPEISAWGETISRSLDIRGAWFFQYKLNGNQEPVLLEIGLRIGGASGINRLRGVNLSLLNLHQFSEKNVDLLLYNQSNACKVEMSESIQLGFDYREIYVDLDDTIILGKLPNHPLLRFLITAMKSNIRVHLITRNPDPHSSLRGINIEPFLFNSIIIVKQDEAKSERINVSESFLFIDDSHNERFEVKSKFDRKVLVLDQTFSWHGSSFNSPFPENLSTL